MVFLLLEILLIKKPSIENQLINYPLIEKQHIIKQLVCCLFFILLT